MEDVNDSAMACRKSSLTITALDDEVLVYDPESRRATCLNSFAAAVLDLCDGEHSPADIAAALPYQDVDISMVWLALADLQKARLLSEGVPAVPAEVAGVSRRNLMKRIGLGAAVAAPVVAGIAVPAAAQTATCLPAGSPCTTGAHAKDACCPGLQCTGQGSFKTCQ
jgi:hypothetical protein